MTHRASRRPPREINYTAQRVLRALEVIVIAPASAPQVAHALGINARTARRILGTLQDEQYVEYVIAPRGRPRQRYVPTVRLLALAAQLAPRLPLVEHGRRAAAAIHETLGVNAAVAVPCYGDVLFVAAAGESGPRRWAMLPAGEHAAGRALLAHREPWRRSHSPPLLSDPEAATIRERRFASAIQENLGRGSLAVVVPDPEDAPIAALAVDGPTSELRHRADALVEFLASAAAGLAAKLHGTSAG